MPMKEDKILPQIQVWDSCAVDSVVESNGLKIVDLKKKLILFQKKKKTYLSEKKNC